MQPKQTGSVFIPEGTYLCSELKVREGIGIHGLPAGVTGKVWGPFFFLRAKGMPDKSHRRIWCLSFRTMS